MALSNPRLTNTVDPATGKKVASVYGYDPKTGQPQPWNNPDPAAFAAWQKTGPLAGLKQFLATAAIGTTAGLAAGALTGAGTAGGLGGLGGTTVAADGTLVPTIPGVAIGTAAGTGGAAVAGSSILSRILPQLISGGTSLISGVIGSNAAKSAAQVQSDAAIQAAQLNAQAGKDAIAFNEKVLAQQQANSQPWIDAGAGALKRIGDITANPYTLPTADEARQTPGYQFAMDQGQKAIAAYEKASGTSVSGKAIKDIDNYAQGTADTNYQNVVNNSMNERAANLNPLLSEAGLGQLSTSQANSNLGTAAGQNANIGMTTAGNVGNENTSAAAARASGYVGSANALGGAISNIGSNLMNTQSIQQILQAINQRSAA